MSMMNGRVGPVMLPLGPGPARCSPLFAGPGGIDLYPRSWGGLALTCGWRPVVDVYKLILGLMFLTLRP